MLTCLAKNDPNETERRALIAEARTQYRFDHRFLAPIPMIAERGSANPTSYPRVAPIVRDFRSDLARIEKELLMLNAVRRGEGRSYEMLLPSAVPNSTSI